MMNNLYQTFNIVDNSLSLLLYIQNIRLSELESLLTLITPLVGFPKRLACGFEPHED